MTQPRNPPPTGQDKFTGTLISQAVANVLPRFGPCWPLRSERILPALSAAEPVEKANDIAGGKGEIAALADQVASQIPPGLCYGPGTVYGCF